MLSKKILHGGAVALIIVVIAIVTTVTLHGDLSKSFLLYAKSFGKLSFWVRKILANSLNAMK